LAAANPSPGRQPVGGRPGGLPAGDGPGGGWRRPAGKPAGRKPLAGGPVWALVVFRRGGAAVPICFPPYRAPKWKPLLNLFSSVQKQVTT